jgi:hypothetical protein
MHVYSIDNTVVLLTAFPIRTTASIHSIDNTVVLLTAFPFRTGAVVPPRLYHVS